MHTDGNLSQCKIPAMHKLITCLLIDDDRDDQEIFCIALNQALPRANCWCAFDCTKAINQIKEKAVPVPDYIFMDWNLPLMDGTECIYRLRELPELKDVCFIILSGLTPPLTPKTMEELGIKRMLKKQSSISKLSEELLEGIKAQWT